MTPPGLAVPIAVAIACLTLGPSIAQSPAGPRPSAADIDRFRALDPAERLRAVEASPEAKTAFEKVGRGDLAVVVTERGSLDAATAANLNCEIKAREKDAPVAIIKWVIADGSMVKKGDRVIELDAPALRDLLKAAAGDADRVRALEVELTKCVVKAPFDGVAVLPAPPVGRFGGPDGLITVGETVREGQKLVQIVDLKKMIVRIGVGRAVATSVRVGQTARVQIDAVPGKVFSGKVTTVAANPAAGNGLPGPPVYPVVVTLDSASDGLKPGMSGDVRIPTGERKGVLVIPASAVLTAGKQTICFVRDGEKLVERPLTTATVDSGRLEVTGGIKEGEIVLVDPLAAVHRTGDRTAPKR